MSSSNTSPLDQNVFDPQVAAEQREQRKRKIQSSLAKRHRKEKAFRFAGFSAVVIGLAFVALLFGSILAKGLPSFWQSSITVPVYFDPAIINVGAKPKQTAGETPAHFEERMVAWQTEMGMVDWDALIVNGIVAKDKALEAQRDDLGYLYTSSEAYRIRDMVLADPSLIGQTKEVKVLADANVDVWLEGKIDRSLPDEQQQLSPEVRQLADQLESQGIIESTFNTNIFVSPDSRSSPATSGLAGAFMGSLFMMLIVIFISIPLGVASAIYLEEFAPKNFITDIIEVNINNLAAASETAETLLESLQKGKKEGGGGSDQFFQTSAVNFLAACIYFFINYGKEPYDKDGKMLIAEKVLDPKTMQMKPTGKVFNHAGEEVEPAYWLGKYSDMPHILSFLNESYQTIFNVLETDNEVAPLLGPFQTALKNKAMEQLEGMIGTLRVYTSRLATKESYWIFHKDGDDFDLKVSDPKNPSYLLIANDPEMESIIGALNALILNRLVTRVNTGQGKNVPVSIIVDELPTLYFHKIDRLIGTARSNKVSVALGFQELPQLEADYGKVGMQKIITTVGNVVSGSARAKETLEWLSSDIFGKVVQLKKGVTIDRDKTSINLNENMDSLVPASKISDMPTGWICGQTARDFVVTKTGMNGSMNIQESEEFKTSKFYCKTDFDMTEIKKEESEYVPLPKFYKFKSKEERERILYKNFVQVGEDVKAMIKEIQQFRTMM